MGLKRAQTDDQPVSPPPTRRKIVSTSSTAKAVHNFFKPASQKEVIPLQWPNTNSSLVKARYKVSPETFSERNKVAAFDFDSTLITTSSGNVFGKSDSDWKWWAHEVPTRLRQLWKEGYIIAIISNQGQISLKPDTKNPGAEKKSLAKFKGKVGFVLAALDIPMLLYAATEQDNFRKPRTGMWDELMRDLDFPTIDLKDGKSFFVGDAAGRPADEALKIKKDHAYSDRGFAENVGLAFYTPEKFFLGQEERPYQALMDPKTYMSTSNGTDEQFRFEKKADVELVVFCGSPGSGKSTLYWNVFKPLGFERVNQDILKSRDRCLQRASEFLQVSKSVVVDNTNADIDVRSKWIALGQKHSVPVRLIWLTTPAEVCQHNNAVRAYGHAKIHNGTTSESNGKDKDNESSVSKEDIRNGNISTTGFNPENRELLPPMAFSGFKSRFQQPKIEEGFFDVTEVDFQVRFDSLCC